LDPFIIFVNLSGIAICIIVLVFFKINYINRFAWLLFWVGILLGLGWEIPLSLINAPFPPSIETIILMITATIWDGGLFLLGYWFVIKICKEPHFQTFKLKELGILLLYGQLSSLIVEILAVVSSGWEYEVTPWNPVLFTFLGGNITLIPQLIWFLAPLAFYMIAIKLNEKI
jgi:hypothetical protein